MAARFKISAFLTARSSRNVEKGTTLYCICREFPRRSCRLRAYVELADLPLGSNIRVSLFLCDALDNQVWDEIEDAGVARQPQQSWVFGLEGKPLKRGQYLLYLRVNGELEDTRVFVVR